LWIGCPQEAQTKIRHSWPSYCEPFNRVPHLMQTHNSSIDPRVNKSRYSPPQNLISNGFPQVEQINRPWFSMINPPNIIRIDGFFCCLKCAIFDYFYHISRGLANRLVML